MNEACGRMITGTVVEGSLNSSLCTGRGYGDWILKFDVLTDAALNSGIQIRSHQYQEPTRVRTFASHGCVEGTHPAGPIYGYQTESPTPREAAPAAFMMWLAAARLPTELTTPEPQSLSR